MPGIVDAELKLLWAKKHLCALDIELEIFSAPSKAYILTRHDDIKNQMHVLSMRLTEVPEQICLIVGDAFYNMRSALDQLVWSLARLSGIPNGTQFPIIERPTPKAFKRFDAQLIGVPDEAICEIKELQPYHRRDAYKSHPLWRLNELCNLDKHRRIPANGSALDVHFPNMTPEDTANG